MKLLDELQQTITQLAGATAAGILARIGASMCSSSYTPPPFLDISANLEPEHLHLVRQCINITGEPDYSNADQWAFIEWLDQQEWPLERWKAEDRA